MQRDNIGIGGSWSEFIDYFVASIKSEDVKLVLHGQSDSGGESCLFFALLLPLLIYAPSIITYIYLCSSEIAALILICLFVIHSNYNGFFKGWLLLFIHDTWQLVEVKFLHVA